MITGLLDYWITELLDNSIIRAFPLHYLYLIIWYSEFW